MSRKKQKGFVYIFSNPSMSGIIKVGRSSRVPDLRTKDRDLNSTGVPTPFVVEYYAFFDDMGKAEQLAHRALAKHHSGKEFFKIDIYTAISAIEELGLAFTRLYIKNSDNEKPNLLGGHSKSINTILGVHSESIKEFGGDILKADDKSLNLKHIKIEQVGRYFISENRIKGEYILSLFQKVKNSLYDNNDINFVFLPITNLKRTVFESNKYKVLLICYLPYETITFIENLKELFQDKFVPFDKHELVAFTYRVEDEDAAYKLINQVKTLCVNNLKQAPLFGERLKKRLVKELMPIIGAT